MRSVVGDETEEGVVFRFVDELESFVGDDIGRIAGVLAFLPVEVHRRVLIAVPTCRHGEPVVEPFLRPCIVAHVPFTAEPNAVSVRGKHLAESGLVREEGVGFLSLVLVADPIVDPMLRRNLTCEEGGPAG